MTRFGGGPRNRASASLIPALDPAVVETVRRLTRGRDAITLPAWDARARLTTGRGGETLIGSLQDCVERWLSLENDRDRAVITCEIALRVPGTADPANRLEAPDIAALAKALTDRDVTG
jgi:sirohydrochlorin ferrochelatase